MQAKIIKKMTTFAVDYGSIYLPESFGNRIRIFGRPNPDQTQHGPDQNLWEVESDPTWTGSATLLEGRGRKENVTLPSLEMY
jgi:hypothetical protein